MSIRLPVVRRGGPVIVDREEAPLGQLLPYRRAHGDSPPSQPGLTATTDAGWELDLGSRGLGDMLLALSMAVALHHATASRYPQLTYIGPRPELMDRCSLPLTSIKGSSTHRISTGSPTPTRWRAVPEEPPTWLDLLDEHRVQAHADLPMRYYLSVEQTLGVRLPADVDPCPAFLSTVKGAEEGHVVFISASSMPARKNYGTEGFQAVAADLQTRWPRRRWRFTLIGGDDHADQGHDSILRSVGRLDAAACVDLFASAEVIVGNDTGLTHLAALTRRPDFSRPTVLGIYGRHGYAKWTTGSRSHHAVATPFSHLMSVADACPVRDGYDDTVWGAASDLGAIPARLIADVLGQITGWNS